MTKFDRKIKKLSNEFQVPEGYHRKVDEVLEKIQEDSVTAPRKKPFVKMVVVIASIDGSEPIVDSPDPEADVLVNSGSVDEYEKKGRIYQKYVCQFRKAVDIDKVLGIYISDYYVPLKEYD